MPLYPKRLTTTIVPVSTTPRQSPPSKRILSPLFLGSLCCAVSALGYSAANMCLCSLAKTADPVWTLAIKESVAVVAVGPWLLYHVLRGRYALPPLKALAGLIAVGVAVQVLGNLMMQGAFGVLGLAVTIPVVYAMNLASTATLGRIALGELVTLRTALAIASLIVAITLLSAGTNGAADATVGQLGSARWALAAACTAGAIYAVMTISIRKSVVGVIPLPFVVLIIPAMGTLTLGPYGLWRDGIDGLSSLRPEHWGMMLLAGTLNFIAFLAYSLSLRWIAAVQANVINAAQVAMAAVGGVLFLAEPPSSMLFVGVGLTIVGIFLIEQPNHSTP